MCAMFTAVRLGHTFHLLVCTILPFDVSSCFAIRTRSVVSREETPRTGSIIIIRELDMDDMHHEYLS